MAQRQRVGFQTRRLGVQIPLGSHVVFWFCPYAQNAHNTHPRRVPLYAVFIDHHGYLPGRGVSLIKKGLRLVWSRIIAL